MTIFQYAIKNIAFCNNLFQKKYTLLIINCLILHTMITQEQILQNILKIRTNKGFTQQNVAEHLGIEQGSYSLIEKGRRELSIERLLQIAIFLEVDVKDIITYPNTEYNNSDDEVKAVLQIELKKDKKEQVMKLIFGDNNLEILNR